MQFNPLDYTTVFLSYDEPNANINYEHLLTICPNAKRVHGVKGSDLAHKTIADISDTDNVIIIDGDNFVRKDFYQQVYDLGDIDISESVVSFTANNIINGQRYGNGSVKCWPKKLLKAMTTHEISENQDTLVDFDFKYYKQYNYIASDLHVNGSPLQAWRSGFREGVKLLLDNGRLERDIHDIDWRNFDRLYNWMHIGSDIENGIYAIHGARFGCWKAVTNFDLKNLNDFDYLNNLFHDITDIPNYNIFDDCNRLGNLIRIVTNDSRIDNIYPILDSKNYRETVRPVLRCPDNQPYDIVFISYDESDIDIKFDKLKQRFPRIKHIHGIKGIHNAHIEAAKICTTDYFYVVDADAEILDSFNFDYVVPFYDRLKVRVYRAKNPVNDLIYGYGGVKLLPRIATIRMNKNNIDMSTSICKEYEPIQELSNITRFNTSPFNAWRSAFRECCKLASEVINGQITNETKDRLMVWQTIGIDREYGKYCIDGAIAGAEYGNRNKDNYLNLRLINDYEFIKTQYNRFYQYSVR